ncbi:MAG: nitrous oxide reductase accessory protein NosL [Deltaproteobacteria bacterium]|nr:nitrous oxide reductase accessory protein NosL [Deltaproteobacteria bacterium]
MRFFLLLALGLFLTIAPAALAEPQTDVEKSRSCRLCGMDRDKFSHSRMLIEYEDGSSVGTCSLHCAAVELANTIDRIPVLVKVADYDSKELIDAEKAFWVMGGSIKGVMTGQPKWAFASVEAAGRFIKAHGGDRASFDEAIKAAYDDMYQDTKIIREFRKLKQHRHNDGTVAK